MEDRSPAQVYAAVIGAALLLAGIAGFFYNASFGSGDGTDRDAVLGILDVNGWHNVVHLASGLFLLALMRRHDSARLAALAFGAIYGVVTIIGLINGHDVLGLLPVNPADNVLHILLTVAAFAAGLAPAGDRTRAATPRAT